MISVHVKFHDGNSLNTDINATIEEARAYYVGQWFNLGDGAGGDRMSRAVSCERTDNLFIGIYPAGISYADKGRELSGDYMPVAFLPYRELTLIRRQGWANATPAMRAAIEADATKMAAKRGERFPISATGQYVILGA